MSLMTMVGLLLLLLIASLALSSYAKRRAQRLAEINAQIDKHESNADSAQQLLANLHTTDIGNEIRSQLAQIVVNSYKQIKELKPGNKEAYQRVLKAGQQRSEIEDEGPQQVVAATNLTELSKRQQSVLRLKRLLQEMDQVQRWPNRMLSAQLEQLNTIYHSLMVDGRISLGHQAMQKEQPRAALLHFRFVATYLERPDIPENLVTAHKDELSDLLVKVEADIESSLESVERDDIVTGLIERAVPESERNKRE